MKQFLQILILAVLISCNKVEITKTEIGAVGKVLEFYGGQIDRSFGFQTKNVTKYKYFELKASKSQLLNNDLQHLTEHAGNIAYLFYSNLGREQSNYDEIRVTILLENGESRNYTFPAKDLKEIENLYPNIEQSNEFIRKGDYQSLAKQFSTKVGPNENDPRTLFEDIYAKHGNFKQLQIQGFGFAQDRIAGKYIYVKEALVVDKNIGAMYLSYDRETKELLGISLP